jgi:hypothetical protein
MRMMRFLLSLLLFGVPAAAQTIESPVAFDSAGRVMAVTAPLVERLHLAAPVWPVAGEFREARLYSVQGGGFVLVVQRPAGIIERWSLSEAQRGSLRGAMDAALVLAGRPSGEPGSEAMSEPVGNAFARRQTLLAALVYGPIASSLVDDGSAAGAAWLLVTGGTFFTTYGMAQSRPITRAQNHLTGHLGVAGTAAGWLLAYAAAGDGTGNERGERGVALGSAVLGSVVGFNVGRNLSDAEAHGVTAGVESGGLTSFALAELAGASSRGAATAVAAGILAGGPVGLQYPRRASYTVTAGDIDGVGTAGLIGGLLAGAVLPENPSQRPAAAILGAGYLTGLFVGDRSIARRFDLTPSESNIAGVGALAGALVGLAIPTLTGSDDTHFLLGAAGVGAALGMGGVLGALPHRAGSGAQTGSSRFRVNFSPAGALGALNRAPGQHPILNVRF